MKKIAVLGAGRIGRAIAADLASDFNVTAVDLNTDALDALESSHSVHTRVADLSRAETIRSIARDHDLVVSAVPGFMGYRTLEQIIRAGRDVVDISFSPEDPMELDQPARENNVTALVDCGVAPGMSNLFAGYHDSRMQAQRFECMVGGLPVKRTKPYEYKAPFSPIDVLEEYTRPARLLDNGKVVTRPALSEPEMVDIDPVGTLEAFNTDGLRTLLNTLDIPNMKEKTLRYPGHRSLMKTFRDTGFLREEAIDIDGKEVRPIDLTTQLLFPHWKLEEREDEFTVMRIVIEGWEDQKYKRYRYDLYDRFDAQSGFSSMARTTGFTCTAAVNLLNEKLFDQSGVYPPELLGRDEQCFQFILNYLEDRSVIYHKTMEEIQSSRDSS